MNCISSKDFATHKLSAWLAGISRRPGAFASKIIFSFQTIRDPLTANPSHLLKERIRSPRIKNLITGHHRNQILRLTEVNNVVGPARNHVDGLYLISGNLKLHHLSGVDVTLLNQTVTGNYDKELPLGVVPMLALCDARL